jgi:hypothetical protein
VSDYEAKERARLTKCIDICTQAIRACHPRLEDLSDGFRRLRKRFREQLAALDTAPTAAGAGAPPVHRPASAGQ